MNGWIKMHRKLLDNPVVCKDSDHLAVWTYLLLNASHKEYPAVFGKEKIILQPGQLITGRKSISDRLRVSESKIQRILSCFESERQIEQQTGNKNRLITVLSWSEYQDVEQQNELEMNNKRTTNEQQVNTNKNLRTKELENLKDITTAGDEFKTVLNAFCEIHGKAEHQVFSQIPDMQKMIEKGIPSEIIISVMKEKHGEKAKRGEPVNSFSYYQNAIIDRWEGGKKLAEYGRSDERIQPRGNKTTSPSESITGGQLGWIGRKKDNVVPLPNVQG